MWLLVGPILYALQHQRKLCTWYHFTAVPHVKSCTVYSSRTPDERVRALSCLFLCVFPGLISVHFFGWVSWFIVAAAPILLFFTSRPGLLELCSRPHVELFNYDSSDRRRGGRRPTGHNRVLTGDCSSSAWYKGVMSSPVGGGAPTLAGHIK